MNLKKWLMKLSPVRRRAIELRSGTNGWSLDDTLITFGRDARISIGNLCEGTFITGGTGAGKTSGSGYLFASTFLNAGFGGLVVTAKPDDCDQWIRLCAECNRLDDLIIFGVDQPHRFNFLDFEARRGGEGGGHTENVVNLFMTIIDVLERASGKTSQAGEQYWVAALRQLLRNLVDLLIFSKGRVTVPDLYRLAISAPNGLALTDEWKQRSFCFQCLQEADKNPKTTEQEADFALVADYFMLEWPNLSDKTRSVVLSTFTSLGDVFNRGVLKTLFSSDTNVTPADIEKGKIIVVNLPLKSFDKIGLIANILWKNSFQHSIERRNVGENPRPVFLWQDEGQLFVTNYDMPFQTTARSSRVANVILTQSLSTFYAVSDGPNGKAQVDSLIGNLNLKVFHLNSDSVTNQWCSDLIGKSRQVFFNGSTSNKPEDNFSSLFGGGSQSSGGYSEQMDYEINPSTFLQMRNGGAVNNYIVDGLLFSPVLRFGRERKNYLPVCFKQRGH